MTSHLRPPRDPGRRVGRVPAPDRRAAPGRGRLLRRRCSARSASTAAPRRAAATRRRSRAAEPAPAAVTPAVAAVADEALLQAVQAATSLVKAHRMHGHLAARPRPARLRAGRRPGARARHRRPDARADGARSRRACCAWPCRARRFADALPHLRETYCGTIAYEIEHISDHEQRVWLRQAIESGKYRRPLSPEEKRRAARAADRGRGARELPAQGVPRQEAVLDRGPRRARADARRDDRAGRRRRRARGRASAWRTAAG